MGNSQNNCVVLKKDKQENIVYDCIYIRFNKMQVNLCLARESQAAVCLGMGRGGQGRKQYTGEERNSGK